MDLDPRLLRTFVVVLRCGSVTRAAEQLHISQPSVSKALSRLESAVGFTLFERRGRNLYPTEKAQLIGESAERVERELEAIRRRVTEVRGGRELGFTVASIPAFANSLLPKAIVELQRQRPDATLKVEVWRREKIIAELDAGRVDIGLIHSSSEHVPNGFRMVANGPLRCVMPIHHPLASTERVEANMLSKEKLVVFHNSMDIADEQWRILDRINPPPIIIVEASQISLLRDLVRRGVGIGLIDGFTADDDTIADLVTKAFAPTLPFHLAIGVGKSRVSANARALIEIIHDLANKTGKRFR